MTDESCAGDRFGDCELLLATRELRVGAASRPVEPQVVDLLPCLVKAGARVVSRDELVAEAWRGRVVSDSAISARISAARSAIGDDGTAQRWIRTAPRRGLRFAGEVQTVPVRAAAALDRFDVSDLLPGVRMPTLVLHSRDDAIQPVEQGRELASGIPGAEFVLLESANHVLLPEETAWRELFDEMGRIVPG